MLLAKCSRVSCSVETYSAEKTCKYYLVYGMISYLERTTTVMLYCYSQVRRSTFQGCAGAYQTMVKENVQLAFLNIDLCQQSESRARQPDPAPGHRQRYGPLIIAVGYLTLPIRQRHFYLCILRVGWASRG